MSDRQTPYQLLQTQRLKKSVFLNGQESGRMLLSLFGAPTVSSTSDGCTEKTGHPGSLICRMEANPEPSWVIRHAHLSFMVILARE